MRFRDAGSVRSRDVAILFALTFGLFLTLKIRQYLQFNVGSELADYETILWNTLHGRFLQVKSAPVPFLAEHFSPVLLLGVPIYALAPSPWTLLVLQALIGAAAVIPLYLLTAAFTPLRWPPIALGIAYAASRVVNYGLMYDVHPEILYPLLFFGVFLALERKRWTWYAALLAIALMVKEDAFVAAIGLGAYAFARGHRKAGAITALVGALGLVLVMAVVIPHFRGPQAGEYKFATYWSGYGSTRAEVARNLLNPAKHLEVLFRPEKLPRMFNLFSVYLFLPLASLPGLAFLVVPNWFILYSSDNGMLNGPILYYGLLITPFLFYAALVTLRGFARRWPARAGTIFMVATTFIAAVQLGNTRLAKQLFHEPWTVPERYAVAAPAVIARIPRDAGTSAQGYLCSHVPVHEHRDCFPFGLDQADYALLDARGNPWPSTREGYTARVDSLRAAPDWRVVTERDGFLLMRRER